MLPVHEMWCAISILIMKPWRAGMKRWHRAALQSSVGSPEVSLPQRSDGFCLEAAVWHPVDATFHVCQTLSVACAFEAASADHI